MQGNEFWLGMGYTLFWAAVLAAMGLPFGLLYLVTQKRRSRRSAEAAHGRPSGTVSGSRPVLDPDSWAAMRMGQQAPAPHPRSATKLPPAPAPSPVHALNPRVEPTLESPPHPQRLVAAERRHTMLVGSEGEGKTQSQIAFLVQDIANGEQVIWASTNLALYHSRDQQTDLRPIAHLFEQTRDPLEIMAVLQWASWEVDRRMPFYHEDMPHGQPIVIHIDELGGLYRRFGDTLVKAMRNIAEQGRKVDVFLFLVAHNALKESTGLDAALKPLFKTRLLGTVDQFTWTALVGPGVKLKSKPDAYGVWHQPDKQGNVFEVMIRRPTAQDIALVARRRESPYSSILEAAEPFHRELEQQAEATAGVQRMRAAARVADEAEREELAPLRLPPEPAGWVPPAGWPPECPREPTERFFQVREMIEAAMPEIIRLVTEGRTLDKAREISETSNRAIAKRLGLGEKGGQVAVDIGKIIRWWENPFGVRLFAPAAEAEAARIARSERQERPERAERPEQANTITPAA